MLQTESPLLDHQAEDYTAINGVSEVTNHAGFTGDAFMNFGGSGTCIEWSNVSAGPGTVTLNFRYANGSKGDRQCAVLVNGIDTGNVAFNVTSGWSRWETVLHTVTLPLAINTIRVQANTGSGGPNLDKKEIVIEELSNTAPVITSTSTNTVAENTAYGYPITVTDADSGDVVTITVPVKSDWLNFDGTVLSGTATSANIGSHPVEIVATDSFGAMDT